MKKIFLIITSLSTAHFSQSQILKNILDRTKQKTEYKVSEKVSEKVSDAATKPIDDAGNVNNKDARNNKNSNNTGTTVNNTNEMPPAWIMKNFSGSTATLATYSKYDFVPGKKFWSLKILPRMPLVIFHLHGIRMAAGK